jgi:hypothetical protein
MFAGKKTSYPFRPNHPYAAQDEIPNFSTLLTRNMKPITEAIQKYCSRFFGVQALRRHHPLPEDDILCPK